MKNKIISVPLLKHFIKKHWKLFAIFAAIHLFYMGIIAAMSNSPLMTESISFLNIEIAVELLSRAQIAVMLTAATFYGLIVFIFSMIYYVIVAQDLVYKAVDSTSLSAYLSSSMSRKQYIVTAGVFLAVSLFVLYALLFVLSGVIIAAAFGSFNWGHWANMHLTVFLASLAVGFLSFGFSAIFSGTKWGKPLLVGVPIAFGAFMMLGQYLDFFSYLTPFGWFDATEIAVGASGTLWWLWDLIFLSVTGISFLASVFIFDKKQLSI